MSRDLERLTILSKARARIKEQLHNKQLEVWDAPERFKVVVAGRKWRKTSLVVLRLFDGALTNGLVYSYIAPFRRQAKDIVWADHVLRVTKMLKSLHIPFVVNESELSVTIPWTGGKVNLFGVDNAESLRGISNWGGVACDEYADWRENIWPTIIRPNLITHQGWAIISGTPKGQNHLWDLYTFQNPDYRSFHYTSYDNPELPREELASLESEFAKFGDTYFRQEMMATFEKPYGAVYAEWDPSTNWVDVEYDANLPLHVSFDWGVHDPTAIIWIQPCAGEFHVIDYYEASDGGAASILQVLNSKPYKTPDLYTGDPAGKARSIVTATSIIDELMKSGVYVRSKDGVSIPNQVRVTHQYIPSLFVSKRLPRFRDCLLNYRYPTNDEKTSRLDTSNEKPIHNEFSHAMRALEYWATNLIDTPSLPGFLRENEEEEESPALSTGYIPVQ